jgi:hypothetical protein
VVTGVLVKVGGSLTLATVMVKTCVSVNPPLSVTRSTTAWSPTSALAGAPESVAVPSPWSVSVSQAGSVGAVMVSASPWIRSGSAAVTA